MSLRRFDPFSWSFWGVFRFLGGYFECVLDFEKDGFEMVLVAFARVDSCKEIF